MKSETIILNSRLLSNLFEFKFSVGSLLGTLKFNSKMKYLNLVFLSFILILPLKSFSKTGLCEAAYNSNFQQVANILKVKVKEVRREAAFSNNYQRIDSLASWFKSFDCVIDASWNRNTSFILTTLTFHRSLSVIFQTKDSIAELCFDLRTQKQRFGDYLYWRWGVDVPDRNLTYTGYRNCEGSIQQRHEADSINQRSLKIEKHNYSVRFSMSIVDRNGKYDYGHGKPEGEPIYVKLTVSNNTDSVKVLPWPKYQNDGLKMVYFELMDSKRKHLFTENRKLNMVRNETIPYDLLRLEPGENKTFIHVINGDCKNPEYKIECEHFLGLIKEGEYHINAWYNPFGYDYPPHVWLPKEKDSLFIQSQDHFRSIRDGHYYAQIVNLGPKNRDSITRRSECIFDLELLGKGGNYQSSKIGEMEYDGWGVITKVEMGNLQIGDTVAFSLRNTEDLKMLGDLKENQFYKIHASWSNSECFQIEPNYLSFKKKGKTRNFQLVDFPNAIQKIERP